MKDREEQVHTSRTGSGEKLQQSFWSITCSMQAVTLPLISPSALHWIWTTHTNKLSKHGQRSGNVPVVAEHRPFGHSLAQSPWTRQKIHFQWPGPICGLHVAHVEQQAVRIDFQPRIDILQVVSILQWPLTKGELHGNSFGRTSPSKPWKPCHLGSSKLLLKQWQNWSPSGKHYAALAQRCLQSSIHPKPQRVGSSQL